MYISISTDHLFQIDADVNSMVFDTYAFSDALPHLEHAAHRLTSTVQLLPENASTAKVHPALLAAAQDAGVITRKLFEKYDIPHYPTAFHAFDNELKSYTNTSSPYTDLDPADSSPLVHRPHNDDSLTFDLPNEVVVDVLLLLRRPGAPSAGDLIAIQRRLAHTRAIFSAMWLRDHTDRYIHVLREISVRTPQ
jgi:hypothetical protein